MFGYGYGLGCRLIGGYGFMMLIPIALIGLIIYAVIKMTANKEKNMSGSYVTNYDNRFGQQYETTSQALKILNDRFAAGEISEEEYKRKKDLIQ